jgi:anti-sigma factor RsiW
MMCRSFTESTTDASEGALPWGKRLRYRIHLATCPFCQKHHAQVETTVATLRALPKPDPSEESVRVAAERFRNRKR